jgi:hypothetical protein
MLFASSEQILKSVKIQLSTEWEITDLGEPAKIVGIEITKTRDSIRISQEKYIDSILKRQGMEGANPVSTPMDTNDIVGPNPDRNEGNHSNSYAQLLGELQFLVVMSKGLHTLKGMGQGSLRVRVNVRIFELLTNPYPSGGLG